MGVGLAQKKNPVLPGQGQLSPTLGERELHVALDKNKTWKAYKAQIEDLRERLIRSGNSRFKKKADQLSSLVTTLDKLLGDTTIRNSQLPEETKIALTRLDTETYFALRDLSKHQGSLGKTLVLPKLKISDDELRRSLMHEAYITERDRGLGGIVLPRHAMTRGFVPPNGDLLIDGGEASFLTNPAMERPGWVELKITRAESPELFETLERAAQQGLKVKVTGLTRDEDGEKTWFRVYKEYQDREGLTREMGVGYSFSISRSRQDYTAVRNHQIGMYLDMQLEHPPVIVESRVPGQTAPPIEYNSSRKAWRAFHQLGGDDKIVALTDVQWVNGEQVFEYRLYDRDNPQQALGSPIRFFGNTHEHDRNAAIVGALRQLDGPQSEDALSLRSATYGIKELPLYEGLDSKTRQVVRSIRPLGYDLCLTKISANGFEYRVKDVDRDVFVGDAIELSPERHRDSALRDLIVSRQAAQVVTRNKRWKDLGIAVEDVVSFNWKTSKEFRAQLEDQFYNLAQREPLLIHTLIDQGVTIRGQHHTLQEEYRDLKGTPPGYSVGATWNAVPALYSSGNKEIVINEYTLSAKTQRWNKSEPLEIRRSIAHELGHAFDDCWAEGLAETMELEAKGNPFKWLFQKRTRDEIRASYFSNVTPQMENIYQQDFQALPREWQDRRNGPLSYYLQGDGRGERETFAEAFQVWFLDREADNYTEFQEHFPTVLQTVGQMGAIYDRDQSAAAKSANDLKRRF